MAATYNSQLGSKKYYHKLTLLLITRSSTSLSALHVVVLFESFTIAISLRKQKNHNTMHVHSWVLPVICKLGIYCSSYVYMARGNCTPSSCLVCTICQVLFIRRCILWLDGLDFAVDSYQMRAFRMFLELATHYTILMLGMGCHTCAQCKMVTYVHTI